MRLNHVAIAVRDMEKSLKFYRDGLGLTLLIDEIISGSDLDMAVMEKDAKIRMVMLSDETGSMIELLGWQSRPVVQRPDEYLGFTSTGLVEVCLMVSDLNKLQRSLEELGFEYRTPVWDFGNVIPAYQGPPARVTHVSDPDGVQVELIQV